MPAILTISVKFTKKQHRKRHRHDTHVVKLLHVFTLSIRTKNHSCY